MKHHSPPTSPVRTGVAVTLSASAAIAILAMLPLASPPANPARVVDWWSQVGTAQGAVALVRIAGIATATYVAVVGGLVTLSTLACLPRLARTMARGLPTGIQRSLAGVTIAASTLCPSFAASAHTDPLPTPIVLFDPAAVRGSIRRTLIRIGNRNTARINPAAPPKTPIANPSDP